MKNKKTKKSMKSIIYSLLLFFVVFFLISNASKSVKASGNTITFNSLFTVGYNFDNSDSFSTYDSPVEDNGIGTIYFIVTDVGSDTPYVSINDLEINPSDGVYSVSNISSNTTISIGKTISLDVYYGNINISSSGYTGYDTEGASISANEHNVRDLYLITQEENTNTYNNITITNVIANIRISGVNIVKDSSSPGY